MKYPDWLDKLTPKDEHLRAHHGLTPKRDGWYKSIGGKTRYVAKPMPVADAVALIPAAEARAAGGPRLVTVSGAGLTIESLAELYVAWLWQRHTTGLPKKLARRTYDDNVEVLEKFVAIVGPTRSAESIGPADFSAFARRHMTGRAASTRRRYVIYLDAFANWAAPGKRRAGHLSRPWMMGEDFRKPAEKEMRDEAADADKAYSPGRLRSAFKTVSDSTFLTAAAHLGLNCGFIPKDVATLPESVVDLAGALIVFPRGKTGVGRICPLLPQTVRALRAYLKTRPAACAPEAKGLFFRTANGNPIGRHIVDADVPTDVACDYNTLSGQWTRRVGLPFSGLRSTLATLADDWPDQRAVDALLGHTSKETVRTQHYAKALNVDRVRKLVRHVWKRAFTHAPPPSRRRGS